MGSERAVGLWAAPAVGRRVGAVVGKPLGTVGMSVGGSDGGGVRGTICVEQRHRSAAAQSHAPACVCACARAWTPSTSAVHGAAAGGAHSYLTPLR
jgi:hypothetical protein